MNKRRRAVGSGSLMGDMVGMGIGNIVGTAMIGATATGVAALPAGSMGRSIAGIVPGLQATSLIGANLGMMGKKRKRII